MKKSVMDNNSIISDVTYRNYLKKIDVDTFLQQIIVPSFLGLTAQDIIFTIHDLDEKLILLSDKFAQQIGFSNYKLAINKYPGKDYPRYVGEVLHFEMQKKFLQFEKQPFDYIYRMKDNVDNTLYLCTSEPIININGEVIAKKEMSRPIKLLSHRDIIEKHFKRFGTNIASLKNISPSGFLFSKTEEIILFMLIGGYTQKEIAEFLNYSRSYIVKIIAENICPKLGINFFSTKLLIEKAIDMGFGMLIPEEFLLTLNNHLNLYYTYSEHNCN